MVKVIGSRGDPVCMRQRWSKTGVGDIDIGSQRGFGVSVSGLVIMYHGQGQRVPGGTVFLCQGWSKTGVGVVVPRQGSGVSPSGYSGIGMVVGPLGQGHRILCQCQGSS